jgi:hypothetical protein
MSKIAVIEEFACHQVDRKMFLQYQGTFYLHCFVSVRERIKILYNEQSTYKYSIQYCHPDLTNFTI